MPSPLSPDPRTLEGRLLRVPAQVGAKVLTRKAWARQPWCWPWPQPLLWEFAGVGAGRRSGRQKPAEAGFRCHSPIPPRVGRVEGRGCGLLGASGQTFDNCWPCLFSAPSAPALGFEATVSTAEADRFQRFKGSLKERVPCSFSHLSQGITS